MRKTTLTILIILIIAFGVRYWQKKQTPLKSSPNETNSLVIGKNAIYATEQKPGNKLMVEFALLAAPGFVVIHENNTGQPGKISGVSALLAPGKTQGVLITLGRGTKNQETLFAMLHRDNGDGVFDQTSDPPILENGEPVMMEFAIDEGAQYPGDVKL